MTAQLCAGLRLWRCRRRSLNRASFLQSQLLTQDWSATWCAGIEIWLDYQMDTNGVQVLTEVSSRTTAVAQGA